MNKQKATEKITDCQIVNFVAEEVLTLPFAGTGGKPTPARTVWINICKDGYPWVRSVRQNSSTDCCSATVLAGVTAMGSAEGSIFWCDSINDHA